MPGRGAGGPLQTCHLPRESTGFLFIPSGQARMGRGKHVCPLHLHHEVRRRRLWWSSFQENPCWQSGRLMIIGPPSSCTPGITGSTSQRAKTRTDRCSLAVKGRLFPLGPRRSGDTKQALMSDLAPGGPPRREQVSERAPWVRSLPSLPSALPRPPAVRRCPASSSPSLWLGS